MARNRKTVTKGHGVLCDRGRNIGVALDHVTNVNNAVIPGNDFDELKNYEDSEEEDD